MSSRQEDRPRTGPAPDASRWLGRAWAGVALVPVFFFIAFAVGQGIYAAMGYKPENADTPGWAVLVASVLIVAISLIPCIAAVHYGMRASNWGDRRGLFPAAVGAVVGVGLLVLTIASEAGNIVGG